MKRYFLSVVLLIAVISVQAQNSTFWRKVNLFLTKPAVVDTTRITSKVMCYPMPNYIGSAAVGLTMGRVYFSTQFTYNRFYFRSSDAFNAQHEDLPEDVTLRQPT